MDLELSPQPDLLVATLSGEFSLPEAKRTFVAILNAAIECRLTKLLLDGFGVQGKPETIERFLYGEFVAETIRKMVVPGTLQFPRIAYLLKPPVLDPGRLGETAAVNRGANVKTFQDRSEALRWLNAG